MFDESLNQKMQEKQVDIHVRYWGGQKAVVTTYLGSQFMGKFFVLIRNIQFELFQLIKIMKQLNILF